MLTTSPRAMFSLSPERPHTPVPLLLTRDGLREELLHFAQGELRRELGELGMTLKQSVHDEFLQRGTATGKDEANREGDHSRRNSDGRPNSRNSSHRPEVISPVVTSKSSMKSAVSLRSSAAAHMSAARRVSLGDELTLRDENPPPPLVFGMQQSVERPTDINDVPLPGPPGSMLPLVVEQLEVEEDTHPDDPSRMSSYETVTSAKVPKAGQANSFNTRIKNFKNFNVNAVNGAAESLSPRNIMQKAFAAKGRSMSLSPRAMRQKNRSLLPTAIRRSRTDAWYKREGEIGPKPEEQPLTWDGFFFDYCITAVIILNGIFIGFQTEYMAKSLTDKEPIFFLVCEYVFCAIFTAELVLRLWKWGRRFFVVAEWRWNVFDLVLVVLQLVEAFTLPFTGDNANTNFTFIRVLRVLRILRTLRLVRLLEFVSELKMLVSAVIESLRSLVWAVIMLLLMIYIVGIAFTQMVVQHRVQSKEEELGTDHDQLSYWWGSLGRSCLSLYEAILGGADWDDLLEPLTSHISNWLVPVFGLYIAFAVLATMNVITGIFVESALKNAEKEKAEEFRAAAQGIFRQQDLDGSGEISREEFFTQIDDPQFTSYLRSVDVDPTEAKFLFKLLDVRNESSINSEELVNGLVRLRSAAKYMDLMSLRREFDNLYQNWDQWARQLMDSIGVVVKSTTGENPFVCRQPSGRTAFCVEKTLSAPPPDYARGPPPNMPNNLPPHLERDRARTPTTPRGGADRREAWVI
mmetsp:Transcript_62663/g.176662  ORF Transcript_62663/g.176662 Transcript_62663/m.176662 type:complete len:746 (+) Transcript_62663:121-2358(+)